MIKSENTYEIWQNGDWRSPIVLSAPHAGTAFPESFLRDSPLSKEALLATADLHTETLVQLEGVHGVSANFARSFVDLNRARTQLDPAIIEGLAPTKDMQVIGGYGVLPRFAARKNLTMVGKISPEMAENRLCEFYDPYHDYLAGVLRAGVQKFGSILLIDVHSAPPVLMGDVDVIIGSCFGESISALKLSILEESLENAGISFVRDIPFAGGFITQNYHQMHGVETVQIEVSRGILNSGGREAFQGQWFQTLRAILKRL